MYREPTDPPLELNAEDVPRRPKTALILGAFALVVAGTAATLFMVDKRDRARKHEAVQTAWSKLSTCLVGDPVANDEKASARVRGIQLAIAEEDFKKGKEPASEVWPFRCHAQTQALIHVLNAERLAKAGDDDLAARTDVLARLLTGSEQEQRLGDLSLVDGVWDKARAMGLVASRNADVRAPDPPKKPLLSLAELRKVRPLATRPIVAGAIKQELHRHRDLAFAVADAALPSQLWCKGSEQGVTCAKLPSAATAVGGEPLLQAARDPGVAPVVVFGPNASVGAWTLDDGKQVIKGEKFGWAYHRKDGAALSVSYREADKDKLRFVVDDKDGPLLTPPGKVNVENLYYAAAVVPGFLLWRGANDEGSIRLFAQSLEGSAPGPVEDVGEISGWYATGTAPQFASCHTGDALVVTVKGKYTSHVTIRRNGTWTVPAKIDLFDHMTCRKAEVTFTSANSKNGDHVRQVRCANGICDSAMAVLPAFGARRAITTDTGVVTVARVGERGGLHLRTGAIEALGSAKGAPLFDDLVNGESILRAFELLPFGASSALVLSTTEGTWLVRIDGDGKVTPIDVTQT